MLGRAPRIFDAHFHIIDPRFPLVPNNGYLPPAFAADDYRAQVRALGIESGAIVSGSFQAFDQGYLLAALGELGPGFVGVTQLPRDASDKLILELDAAGVRAVRFNLYRGGSEAIDAIEAMAHRIFDLARWHVELYADAAELAELVPTLTRLPQVVIDHLGMSRAGLPTLLKLAEGGAKVKATGFGRVSVDVAATLKAIAGVDPHALMFGTDLPSTRAPRPFEATDIDLLCESLGDDLAQRALFENAAALYRPNEKRVAGAA
jgi:predicted TIM-barrel fold metal-dependent hydrolase